MVFWGVRTSSKLRWTKRWEPEPELGPMFSYQEVGSTYDLLVHLKIKQGEESGVRKDFRPQVRSVSWGEMAQLLRVGTALGKDTSSAPSTCVRWLTTA